MASYELGNLRMISLCVRVKRPIIPQYIYSRDAGVMYPDGSIIVKGRKADAMRFKVNGDVVYPGPIEQKVSQHPNVLQISVSRAARHMYHMSS